jgi:hypothetical protein
MLQNQNNIISNKQLKETIQNLGVYFEKNENKSDDEC